MLFLSPVPTAGNFFSVRYSYDTTDRFLCIMTRCTGRPFPTTIAGVNDGNKCKAKRVSNINIA
jgi:hypothetical protein